MKKYVSNVYKHTGKSVFRWWNWEVKDNNRETYIQCGHCFTKRGANKAVTLCISRLKLWDYRASEAMKRYVIE